MTKTFKTLGLSSILAVAFLSAGAFADTQENRASSVTNITSKNVTNIYKNSTWPLAGQITMDACKINRCQEV
jgi:hypothetical protein